jgi:hypothetical protein
MSRRSNVRRSNVRAQMWALKGRVTVVRIDVTLKGDCAIHDHESGRASLQHRMRRMSSLRASHICHTIFYISHSNKGCAACLLWKLHFTYLPRNFHITHSNKGCAACLLWKLHTSATQFSHRANSLQQRLRACLLWKLHISATQFSQNSLQHKTVPHVFMKALRNICHEFVKRWWNLHNFSLSHPAATFFKIKILLFHLWSSCWKNMNIFIFLFPPPSPLWINK